MAVIHFFFLFYGLYLHSTSYRVFNDKIFLNELNLDQNAWEDCFFLIHKDKVKELRVIRERVRSKVNELGVK